MNSGIRGRIVSQVFQNPLSSLNPYKKIGKQIMESILINSDEEVSKEEAYSTAVELLESVMINNAPEIMEMYPHQMSGGMNQRIVIVTILAAKPDLIIFDEPTTALDPVAQAQIIEIIREINRKTNVGMIFISHDIALVASIADTIAIMYAGSIVEKGKTKEIVNRPLHPYT
jgi:oligopeptide transport system ATP-binding protein